MKKGRLEFETVRPFHYGLEMHLARTIKAITEFASDVVIIDRERCLASGMDGYLSKPLERAALMDVLDRASQASVFTVLDSPLTADPRRGGQAAANELGAALSH